MSALPWSRAKKIPGEAGGSFLCEQSKQKDPADLVRVSISDASGKWPALVCFKTSANKDISNIRDGATAGQSLSPAQTGSLPRETAMSFT